MSKSKVFMTDLRTKPGNSLLDKLKKLMVTAGFDSLDLTGKFTAIKIHFGEPGNLAYIRSNYAAAVVEMVQRNRGLAFLTDSNTLYHGSRSNAVDHLTAAMKNGFNPLSCGCPVIIADGLKGSEFREIRIEQMYCRTAKIGSAIADADVIISMTHFKGHEMTGFGGVLKNIGMGSGSCSGKLEMHSASKPRNVTKNCTGCGICILNCSQHAIAFNSERRAVIDYDRCIGCGQCVAMCRFNAMQVIWDESADTATMKIAEYALAVLKDKPQFHLSFVMSVSPNCDCYPNNDVPIIQDIGILASMDPVALDRACVDLVNAAPAMPGSVLDQPGFSSDQDKFGFIHPNTHWKLGLDYAETIGLGTQNYELIPIK
ncbi:MAG: DUF362 domain-containing protein [Candidatus Delongbacteria bacterium]|nr:DUF362 domain-containing protein [Candidatus Delongbacteria bacterium]